MCCIQQHNGTNTQNSKLRTVKIPVLAWSIILFMCERVNVKAKYQTAPAISKATVGHITQK